MLRDELWFRVAVFILLGLWVTWHFRRIYADAAKAKARRLEHEKTRVPLLEGDVGSRVNIFWRSDHHFGRFAIYDDTFVLVTDEWDVTLRLVEIIRVEVRRSIGGRPYVRLHHSSGLASSPVVVFGDRALEIAKLLVQMIPDVELEDKRSRGRKKMKATSCIVVVVCFLFTSCRQEFNDARAAVDDFHRLYSKGDFEAVYGMGAPELRGQPKSEVVRAFSDLATRTGRVRSAREERIKLRRTATGEALVVALYVTQFERGQMLERFTWRRTRGKLALAHYEYEGLPKKR